MTPPPRGPSDLLDAACWGTVGRPWTERLMRLPCRMCPLGMGIVAWLFERVTDARLEPGRSASQRVSTFAASDGGGCGLACLWAKTVCNQSIGDTPRSGSPLWRRGRSLVVFTEGADSSPLDWGSVPEACEIGGLGTLAAVPFGLRRPRGRCPFGVRGWVDDLNRSVTKLWPGKGLSGLGTRCLVRPQGRARRTVTWLILPVVICLSQRLSHACLSINNSIL